jgi:hypothetical protein
LPGEEQQDVTIACRSDERAPLDFRGRQLKDFLERRHPGLLPSQKRDEAIHDQQNRDHEDKEDGRPVRHCVIQSSPKVFLQARRHARPVVQTKPPSGV